VHPLDRPLCALRAVLGGLALPRLELGATAFFAGAPLCGIVDARRLCLRLA
jgi:hypothetical protein